MKVCVLGIHSLIGPGTKVGIQHIAETLAHFGHDVTYVTSHASPLMLLHPGHRARFTRTGAPIRLTDRLTQVTPVNLLPARVHQRLERAPGAALLTGLDRRLERMRSAAVEQEQFDVCIFSCSATMSLVERVNARRLYYRLHDLLSGFDGIPKTLLEREAALLRSGRLNGVWAVNEQLAAFARQTAPSVPVHVIPNGVQVQPFRDAEPDPELLRTRERNVIFVGAVEFWIDVPLILATARLMPEWEFHIYGPWTIPVPEDLPGNVHVYGSIPFREIPSKLKACTVGIIPAGVRNRELMVEQPLKYYEYLAADLGVAATSHAGKDLEPFAVLGDSAEEFARAIVAAEDVPRRYGPEMAAVVAEREWPALVRRMLPDA